MGHKMQFCPLSILLFKFYFYKPVNAFSSIIKLEQVKKKIDRFISNMVNIHSCNIGMKLYFKIVIMRNQLCLNHKVI
jgi:hypothetical protein